MNSCIALTIQCSVFQSYHGEMSIKALMWTTGAALALLAACSGNASGGGATLTGSTVAASSGAGGKAMPCMSEGSCVVDGPPKTCTDYSDGAKAMAGCPANFSASPCPLQGVIGGCKTTQAGLCGTQWRYADSQSAVDQFKDACKNSGGTWITP
jgi:hypothetical protein